MKATVLTWGCQMSKYESRYISSLLEESRIEVILPNNDNNSVINSDIVILNTCSVRESVEKRIFDKLKMLSSLKKKEKNKLIIGVCGCLAQNYKEMLFKIFPNINFVLGPDNLRYVVEAIKNNGKFIQTSFTDEVENNSSCRISLSENNNLKTYLPISYGCDNFCSYCIVPYVRGRKKDRSHISILEDLKRLQDQGFKDITLLGQNITAYSCPSSKNYTLPDLLYDINKLITDKTLRIRFLTSHPKYFSDTLIYAVLHLSVVCESIHLPLQAGSDRILKLMNRNYSVSFYKELICKIQETISDVSITTDMIVGFPTETEEDFKESLSMINEIKPDASFVFIYSRRPKTKAYDLEDLPYNIKQDRLTRLIDLQKEISRQKNKSLIGTEVEVLVEGRNPRNSGELYGRSRQDKVVVFKPYNNHEKLIGKVVKTKVYFASTYYLKAELL